MATNQSEPFDVYEVTQAEWKDIENRFNEIGRRLNKITAERESLNEQLGQIRLAKGSTAKVHKRLNELTEEQQELLAENRALSPVLADIRDAWKHQQALKAVEKARELVDRSNELAGQIFGMLDSVHVLLSEHLQITHKLDAFNLAAQVSGLHCPSSRISLNAERIWPLVHEALTIAGMMNGSRWEEISKDLGIAPDGTRVLEFRGTWEIKR